MLGTSPSHHPSAVIPPVAGRRRSASDLRRRRFVVPTRRLGAQDVIGIAHLVTAAAAVVPAVFILLMNVEYPAPGERAAADRRA